MGKAYIVCGSPGAGKSTYGKKLAEKVEGILVDIDTCTEQLVQSSMRAAGKDINDRDSGYFKEHFRESVYLTLFAIAKENLPWVNAVIVGPFTKELRKKSWPDELRSILNSEVEVHYVACSEAKRKARLISRNNPRDIQKIAKWDEHIHYLNEQRPEFEHTFVNSDIDL